MKTFLNQLILSTTSWILIFKFWESNKGSQRLNSKNSRIIFKDISFNSNQTNSTSIENNSSRI